MCKCTPHSQFVGIAETLMEDMLPLTNYQGSGIDVRALIPHRDASPESLFFGSHFLVRQQYNFPLQSQYTIK